MNYFPKENSMNRVNGAVHEDFMNQRGTLWSNLHRSSKRADKIGRRRLVVAGMTCAVALGAAHRSSA
jgi:hypothetical protein